MDSEILHLITTYGYFVIFPVAIFEGPIISLIVGFMVSTHYFNFWIVLTVLFLADLVGDILYYSAGRFGGTFFIDKWGKFFKITDKKMAEAGKYLLEHKKKAIYFGKFIHGLGLPILISIGMSKLEFRKYMEIIVPVSIVKTTALLLLGYFFGSAFNTLRLYLDIYSSLSIIIFVIVILFLILRKYWRRN